MSTATAPAKPQISQEEKSSDDKDRPEHLSEDQASPPSKQKSPVTQALASAQPSFDDDAEQFINTFTKAMADHLRDTAIVHAQKSGLTRIPKAWVENVATSSVVSLHRQSRRQEIAANLGSAGLGGGVMWIITTELAKSSQTIIMIVMFITIISAIAFTYGFRR